MAVKGKGKQVAGKAPASSPSSSFKRKGSATKAETSGARRKKRRSGALQFVDDAAGEADIDEMKEDDELEWEDYDDIDVGLGGNEINASTKVPIKSSSFPVFIKQEEMDDDELKEAIKQRYSRGSDFVSYAEDVKGFDDSEYLVHAPEDLSIWRVKCMIGRERQAAFCLMQKFVDLQKIGKVLQIFSVISVDHVKGFVYIEADKACNVFEACKGLCFLYSSRVDLVPRNEAPNLLSIQSKAGGISKGMWVRMKSGRYKGDLAEVVSVNDVKKRVTIKLVPRIDLRAIAKKFGGGTSLKASDIPAPRLISSHELEDFRPHLEVRRDRETGEIFEVLDGLMLKDGYLYKKVSTCSLIYWGVQPSSAELMKFENMGKDEVKDTSWLSSVYKARMKKKQSETSDPKDGDKSNHKGGCKSNGKDMDKHSQMDGDKQRCTFDLDDLVLFGKKGFGIIVDKENDTVKILKGDIDGPEVVLINAREIKKNCVDKVFTASDRKSKLVNIDDVVKVAEGALEGREGIVRHMYKGMLFIYDECQTENNGFFCAKSDICDLLKKSRDFLGKKGFKASPSFSQSANRFPNEGEENSQSFGRVRQSHSGGTFSVGQNLRICKGPLKGYHCRVIRIHRADVTVKLDSLAKLLTVDEKLLSLPNSRFEETTTQGDALGSQDGQSTGVIMDEGNAVGTDNDKSTAVMSSFSRDSWNAPSSSSFSFQGNNESKDQDQGADVWGSKQSSWGGGQEQETANAWSKAMCSNAEQNSWSKMDGGEKDVDATYNQGGERENDTDDAWNKDSAKTNAANVGWESNNSLRQKTGSTWSMKDSSGGWDKAGNSAPKGSNGGGWSTGDDGWNKAAPTVTTISTETGGWGKTTLPSSDAGRSWDTKDASAKLKDKGDGNDTREGFSKPSGNWSSPNGTGDSPDPWSMKVKGLNKSDEDRWCKSAVSQVKNPAEGNTWDSSLSTSGGALKDPSASGNQTAGWDQPSNWGEIKSAPSSAEWGRSEQANASEAVGWKENTDGKHAAGWSASSAPSVEAGNQTSRWEKSDGPNSSGWTKDKQASSSETGGWNKASNADAVKDRSDSWARPKTFGGNGFNQQSHREFKAGDDWHKDHHDANLQQPKDSDWGQGSGWSQGGSKNESFKNCDQGSDWSQGVTKNESPTNCGQGLGCSQGGSKNESSTNLGQGSGWSQGGSQNEIPKEWGQGSGCLQGGSKNESPKDWAQGSVLSQGGSQNESSKDWGQGSGWSQGGSKNESSKDCDQGSGWSQGGSKNESSKDCDQVSGWSQGGSKNESSKDCDLGSGWSQGGFKNESSPNWGQGSSWSQGGSKNESSIDCGQGSHWSQGGYKNESSTNWSQWSGWSQGGSKSENSRNWSQDNNQNKQRDFVGERGSFRGRGRGRFGGRGDRNEDNSDNGGSWRFGRGGRGQNRPGDENSDNFDGSRQFGQGRGRGEGRGRGRGEGRGRGRGEGRGRGRGEGRGRGWRQFDSSDSRNRGDNFGGGFSSKPSSSWGNEGGGGWGKANANNAENSVATLDEKVGWNSGKSFGGVGSSGWGTGHQDVSGSKTESNVECGSSWSKNMGRGNQSDDWNNTENFSGKMDEKAGWNSGKSFGCVGTAGWGAGYQEAGGGKTDSNVDHGSSWNKVPESDNCNTPKAADNKISSWYPNSSNNAAKDDSKLPSTPNQPSDWKQRDAKCASTSNSSEVSFADWVKDQSEPKANTTDDKWTREKPGSSGHGDVSSTNDWGQTSAKKENDNAAPHGGWNSNAGHPSSEDKADGLGSWGNSKDGVDNNSAGWVGEAKGSFSNRSSEWNNDARDEWSKKKPFDVAEQAVFNESSDGFQGQSRNWNHGSDFGRGRSSGGRGMGNSFYNRGRGRGRNSGGRWNGGDDYPKGNDKRQSFNSTQEESWNRGNKGSFDGGRGSWSSGWQSEGGNEPAGWAKQDSGWASVSVAGKGESSKSVWDATQKSHPAETEENTGRNDHEDVNSGKTGSDWGGKASSWNSEPSPAEASPPLQPEGPKREGQSSASWGKEESSSWGSSSKGW